MSSLKPSPANTARKITLSLVSTAIGLALAACSGAPVDDAPGEHVETTASAFGVRGGLGTGFDPRVLPPIPVLTWTRTCAKGSRVTTPDSFFVRTLSKSCADRAGVGGTWAGTDVFSPGFGECRYTWAPSSPALTFQPDFAALEPDSDIHMTYAQSGVRLITPDCITSGYVALEMSAALAKQLADSNRIRDILFPPPPLPQHIDPLPMTCASCRAVYENGNAAVVLPFADGVARQIVVNVQAVNDLDHLQLLQFNTGGAQYTLVPIPAGYSVLPNGTDMMVYNPGLMLKTP